MRIKNIFITLTIAILTGVGVYYYKPKEAKMNIPFPYTSPVNPSIGINCEAIVGNMMFGKNTDGMGIKKGITAELFKGTDKLAIELDNDGKFSFLTKASLEAGEAKSNENWKVLQNSKNFLIATLNAINESIPKDNYVDMFYLNKENGMGLWVKTQATSIFSDTPEVQSYLVKCN